MSVPSPNLSEYLQLYRELGLAVVPAVYGEKKPSIEWKPYQEAAPDPSQVETWFNDGQPHNIAVLCGKPSRNLVVLDFDDLEVYNKFFEKREELEASTIVVKTGSGKRHVYFKTENPILNFRIPQLKLEVRSTGNVVIAPPSLHPNGQRYELLNPGVKTILTHEGDLEEAVWDRAIKLGVPTPPLRIEGYQDTHPKEAYVGEDPPCIITLLKGVAEGRRNETGIRLATYFMFMRRVEEAEAYKLLANWNNSNIPPLLGSELKNIVKSAMRLNRTYGCRSLQDVCQLGLCAIGQAKARREQEEAEPIILSHLNMIEDPDLAGRPIIVEAIVSSTSMAYLAPTEVEGTFEDRDGNPIKLTKEIGDRDPVNIKFVGVNEDIKYRREKRLFGADKNVEVKEQAWRTIYKIRVRPPVFTLEKRGEKIVDEKGFEYKAFDIYITANKPITFQPSTLIRLEGKALPNPKTQSTTLLAYKVEFPEEVQLFDAEKLKRLKTKFEGLTVKQRLTWILDNFEKFSQIVGRQNLAEGCLLVFFTPLWIHFNGEIQKGWGCILMCGDTTTAKSETIRKLILLLKAGALITAETASTVGLTGTATQVEKEGWFVDWGFLVLLDRQLLAVDGAHKLSTSNWAALGESERSGVVSIAKAAKNTAYARTRQIKIANPVDREAGDKYTTKSLAHFMYPCQALPSILDKTSIARLDLAVFADQRDVKPDAINVEFTGDYDKDLEILGEALKWCWSGLAEVKFTEDAIQTLLSEATNLYNTFFSEMIPLASIDLKWKLARLSLGLAYLTLSTDDFSTVTVTKDHVVAVVEFIKDEYSKAGLNTLAQEDKFEILTPEDIDPIINNIITETGGALDKETIENIFKFIVLQGRVTRDQLLTKFGLAEKNELRPLLATLTSEKLVNAGRGLYATPKLIQIYKLIISNLPRLPSLPTLEKDSPHSSSEEASEKVGGFSPSIGNVGNLGKKEGISPSTTQTALTQENLEAVTAIFQAHGKRDDRGLVLSLALLTTELEKRGIPVPRRLIEHLASPEWKASHTWYLEFTENLNEIRLVRLA